MSSQKAVDEFLDVLTRQRQLSEHTVAAYRRDLKDLSGFLTEYLGTPDWEWSGVDRLTLRSFLGYSLRRGLSRRTIGRKLSAVRGFFRFLHLEDRVPMNPARGMRAPKAEKRLPGHLSQTEVASIFRVAESRAGENKLAVILERFIYDLLPMCNVRASSHNY